MNLTVSMLARELLFLMGEDDAAAAHAGGYKRPSVVGSCWAVHTHRDHSASAEIFDDAVSGKQVLRVTLDDHEERIEEPDIALGIQEFSDKYLVQFVKKTKVSSPT